MSANKSRRSFRAGQHFVEGQYRFTFEEGYEVCRVECSAFYSSQVQNFCRGCKEMDFILYHPQKRELWLIEVKDFRFNARPRVAELCDILLRKLRDALFLLKIAAVNAPQEFPAEGISLRDMARHCSHARKIRVAYTLELSNKGSYPPLHLLVGIRDVLMRQLQFIDPNMLCLPITRSSKVGPWLISPAHGEKSARQRRHLD